MCSTGSIIQLVKLASSYVSQCVDRSGGSAFDLLLMRGNPTESFELLEMVIEHSGFELDDFAEFGIGLKRSGQVISVSAAVRHREQSKQCMFGWHFV